MALNLTKFNTTVNELTSIEIDFADEIYVIILLVSLSSSWKLMRAVESFVDMGTNRKRRVKALEPHSEIDTSKGCNGVEKSRKKSVQQEFHKATGREKDLCFILAFDLLILGKIEKDEHSSLSGSGEALSLRFETGTTNFVEEITKLPGLDLNTGERLHPSAKIKLQLFPINENTRLGLEKDGFHPYLELTLSVRKKISSVLKHLDSKWGSSSIAVGEPMLSPYNIAENLASYRWTRNDTCISARDVYATIGSPAVFRLRYGWTSGLETNTLRQPPALAPFEASSKLEDVQKGCNTHMQNTYGNGEITEVTNEEREKQIIISRESNAVAAEKMPSNGAVDSMDNEVRMDSGIRQSLAMWADSVTNISI
ncbi:TSL-kinase interacting protein 1-like [Durio zibethinus]|uniref:TSL-kinase interacting protein 1-like n=1 Tax=Durio zibethinus TaxID=66656 RepID=A0A6P6BAH3_DURZI|nr:TSL-kinase interacting protein 1-like [Durio zibethinus]